jgi:vesicle-fusing ATPase
MDDFEKALDEVKPAFGAQTELLDQYRTHGIISSGDTFEHLLQTLRTLVLQVRS